MFVFANLSIKNPDQPHLHEARARIEQHGGEACQMVYANELSLELLEEIEPVAVCYSGTTSDDALELEGVCDAITKWPGHQIGFCGGAQIAALLFGCTVDRMRPLREGEPDPVDWYAPGFFKEFGLVEVQITEDDPLFEGLPRTIEVYQLHASMIVDVDPSLKVIASNDTCPVQAFVHRDRPFWGVQFHPEHQPVFHAHGHFLLRNFLKIAKAATR